MAKQEILLETGTNELEILEFYIDEDREGKPTPSYFGVNVAKVMQVIESPGLTPPEAAPHPSFLGIIPLRNLILPVIDLAVWLGVKRAATPYDVVIVTEFSKTVTGFLVTGVTEIHRVGWKEVLPPKGILSHAGQGSIIGLVEREDRFIQLLDLESILADLDPTVKGDAKVTVRAARQYHALVADDSPTIRLLLKDNLEAANFRLTITDNGEEALNALMRLKTQAGAHPVSDLVDVVISDIEMPLMDGFSLTKTIKSDPGLKELPVILYSSIITKELRHKGESVGADEQVSKPELNRMAERAIALIESRSAA